MGNMDIIQIFESGSTVALALVVWHEVKAVRVAVEKLSTGMRDLLSKDIDSRVESATRMGENMGMIKAYLGELVEEKRAAASDTRHDPADPSHLPPPMHSNSAR